TCHRIKPELAAFATRRSSDLGENRGGGGGGSPRPPQGHPGPGADFGAGGAPQGMVWPFRGPSGESAGGADRFHGEPGGTGPPVSDRQSTRLNSSHVEISYAVF